VCTTGGAGGFASVAEALRAGDALADYLNSPAAGDLAPAGLGEVLAALGGIQSRLGAAHAALLGRFDAARAHDGDGYGSSSAWLAAITRMSKRDARASVRQMRQHARHPHLAGAQARGELSQSWAGEITRWLRRLPAELRAGTEQVLAQAAAAGASLDDLATITARALALWQAGHPDPDDDGDFPDRYVQVGTTFGGAGVIRGDLTPECAAAVTAVLQALGKNAGPGDDRTEGQRFHDALQAACELLLRARLLPGRAGADTQVTAHIPLSQLRALPGAPALEDAWIRAILGQDGYLTGAGAQAAACDAATIPLVTGSMDLGVVDRMIDLALAASGHTAPQPGPEPPAPGPAAPGTAAPEPGAPEPGGPEQSGPEPGAPRQAGPQPGASGAPAAEPAGPEPAGPEPAAPRPAGSPAPWPGSRAALAALSPGARQALRHAIARLALDLVSGPGGLASALRTGLLPEPYSSPSLPLDIGRTRAIPAHLRRAVTARDRHCAWPHCTRPAAWCDIHHITHHADGGTTTLSNLILLCQYHHDTCIHRHHWQITLHPDGTTSAYGPRGQVLHSNAPPGPAPPATRAA
jgi:hypothetical protein